MWVNILVRTLATVALFDFCRLPLGEGALIFGMIYNFIPFMIYPIYNTLQKMDRSYIEAAQDLGANSFQVFWKVIFPLSMPGVVSGIMMVFMPTISTFCHCRAVDHEQYQAFRNYHTGKYKQQLVELRSSSFAHHVVPYCRNFLVYSRK